MFCELLIRPGLSVCVLASYVSQGNDGVCCGKSDASVFPNSSHFTDLANFILRPEFKSENDYAFGFAKRIKFLWTPYNRGLY